jgi:hypothetical protein
MKPAEGGASSALFHAAGGQGAEATHCGDSASFARQHRARVAQMLAAAPSHGDVAWNELAQFPDWAFVDATMRDDLAWAAGAWRHAQALRLCIDGVLLSHVRARLGDAAFSALMDDDAPAHAPTDAPISDLPLRSLSELDSLFTRTGREWLLASMATLSLRRCARQLWWPDMPAPEFPAAWHAVAQADVAAAVEHILGIEDESA